jgi:hypothetical protein
LAENSDNILIGMWKSDKAKTLAYIKNVYPDVVLRKNSIKQPRAPKNIHDATRPALDD